MKNRNILFVIAIFISFACSSTQNLGGNDNSEDNNVVNINESSNTEEIILEKGPDILDLSDSSLYTVAENANSEIDMLMKFNGVNESGAEIVGQVHLSGTISRDLPGMYIEMSMEGVNSFDGINYMAMADFPTTDYFYTAESGCLAFSNNEFANPYNNFMQTSEFTGTVSVAERNVEVDGYVADKYLLTSDNLPPDNFDVNEFVELYDSFIFVARDGNFIIRVEFNWLGSNEVFSGNESIVGDNSSVYGFIPINGNVDIEPPQECDVLEETDTSEAPYPIMDDATKVTLLSEGLLKYDTKNSVEDIFEFYDTEMAALGYTIDDFPVYDTGGISYYSIDELQIGLIVSPSDESGSFTVVIGGN